MVRTMRKVRVGDVVRTNQDKTAIVEMIWKQRHRLYRKQVRRVARFYVHDPENQCRLGDTVRIEETRPISKNKHWRLIEILERKQVAEVRPIDLETDVAPEITQPRILAAEARAAAEADGDELATQEDSPQNSIEEEPEAEAEPVDDEPAALEEVEDADSAVAAEDDPAAEEEPTAVEEETGEDQEAAEAGEDTDGDAPDKQEEEK